MKRGVNKVIIIGNLGKDPEVRYMPNGQATATLTVATSDTWKDKNTGQERERTEWHRIVLFGKLAEIAGEYLTKGAQAFFEGELRTRKWTNQQGQDQYTTEIVLQGYDARMQILTGARKKEQNAGGQQQAQQNYQHPQNNQQQQAPQYNEPPMDFDDDIPFAPLCLQYPALTHCIC